MVELKSLSEEELISLYSKLEELRESVNKMVNEYGYTANDLTTRRFEIDIEKEYGRKVLKVITRPAPDDEPEKPQ